MEDDWSDSKSVWSPWFYCLLQSVTTSEAISFRKINKISINYWLISSETEICWISFYFFPDCTQILSVKLIVPGNVWYIWHWIWNVVNAKYDEKKLLGNIYFQKYYRYFINPCVFLMLNELLSVLMQMGNVFILTHLRIHVLLKEWFSRMCVKSIKSISLHILLFAWLFICI